MLFEKNEAEKLIQVIAGTYGYDLSGYSRASLYRRIGRFLTNHSIPGISVLEEKVGQSPAFFEVFLQELTVNVTEMFRDPSFFVALRRNVVPMLSTYPYIKIWDAGCSTGEELYSLTIMLKEENLLERTKIYATDVNQKVLQQARDGIYPLSSMKEYIRNYHLAGGLHDFADYYTARYGYVKFNSDLIKNVVFYPHNLATDSSFNEFHLVICRNVLIYFDRPLQERVYDLFLNSLINLGYLCLGKKESISLSPQASYFEVADKVEKIYRKRV